MQIQYQIIEFCKYIERFGVYDHMAESRYYEVEYKDDKTVQVSLFNNYIVGEKIRSEHQETITFHNVSLKDFCNCVINIYEFKMNMGSFSDVARENIIKKIKIKNIK